MTTSATSREPSPAPNQASTGAETGEVIDLIDATRQRVFADVLKNEGKMPLGWEMTDDLTAPAHPQMAAVKEAAIRAREVVLEEKRVVAMLQQSFAEIARTQTFPESLLTKVPDLDPDVREEFIRALPMLQERLRRPVAELFADGLDLDGYREELGDFLAENMAYALDVNSLTEGARELMRFEIATAVATLNQARRRPVLAHRARGFGKDEASRESLQNALAQNIAEVEFDIRVSKDGRAMIHHNATLGHLAGRPEAVRDLTAAELTAMPLQNGEHLASLRDFFRMIRDTGNEVTKINIDIKDYDEGMLDEILSLVKEYGLEHRAVIVSWFPQALQYMHEKNPTLPYSLSYYPALRKLSQWICRKINQEFGSVATNIPLANTLATRVAQGRARAAQKGNPKVLGTAAEQIDALVLDPNLHYGQMKQIASTKGEPLVGRHSFAMGGAPTENTPGMDVMARVLQHGSVNIMALEEMLASLVDKIMIGASAKTKAAVLNWFRRADVICEFAMECAENGIRVNLFDLKKSDDIAAFFSGLEEADIQGGVVYSSNPDTIERLSLDPKNTAKKGGGKWPNVPLTVLMAP